MAINLNKYRESLISAWKDVLDDKSETNWALFGYDGPTNDLKLVAKGEGGLTELSDDLNSGKILYAFLKVDVPDGSISKYVLINWQGEGAPTVRKGTCANHIREVARLFSGFHLQVHARADDDLQHDDILDRLDRAGSAFHYNTVRAEPPAPAPVGTRHRKLDPVQEINSTERDQFWIKEEQEERLRVQEERQRREQEKRRAEEEARPEGEGTRAPPAPSSPPAPPGHKAEARRLAGGCVSAARARLLHPEPSHPHRPNNAPEKPARSSVIAQRINTFSQPPPPCVPSPPLADHSPPLADPSPLLADPSPLLADPSPLLADPAPSPMRNIDKIALSLQTPSQIQHEPVILHPSPPDDHDRCVYQNIVDDDHYVDDNDHDDDDDADKFSTIKRSPHTKPDPALARQDTVVENARYPQPANGDSHRGEEPEEGAVYEDLDTGAGLRARALYDYQAADETEISFDPGELISHIETIDAGWWQGLGPRGDFGLFPANYVQLLS